VKPCPARARLRWSRTIRRPSRRARARSSAEGSGQPATWPPAGPPAPSAKSPTTRARTEAIMKLRRRGRADARWPLHIPFREVTVLRGSHGWVRLASGTRACVASHVTADGSRWIGAADSSDRPVSSPCHAEGREFEFLHPLSWKSVPAPYQDQTTRPYLTSRIHREGAGALLAA
jgi:hypothetical protein